MALAPEAGGWNRVHLIVDDLPGEVARLRAAGVQFRNDIVTGPGGSQILLRDPAGNLVELFQPSKRKRWPSKRSGQQGRTRATASLWVAINQVLPEGSFTLPLRSP